MKAVGLVFPSSRPDAVAYARQAAKALASRGIAVLCDAEGEAFVPGARVMTEERVPDALVSLGGDGTLLRCAQYAACCGAPLLGINLGRLGFLAETEPNAMEEALEQLLAGRYTLDRRAMLQITLGNESWLAINDMVLSRGGYARLVTLHVLVDGELAGCYRADGVIVATPTGSTGYSLSAGGPIVSPHVNCVVITPVCAHSLQHRPTVVPDTAVIQLQLQADEEMNASLQVDGQNCAVLHAGQTVEVRRAQQSVALVRLKEARFFEVVRRKLVEWSR